MTDTIVKFTDVSRTEGATAQLFRHPVNIKRIDGYCTGANTFLQIFDSKTTPNANDIPLKSLQLFGNDGFSFVFTGRDEIKCSNGVFIGLSTDETKYVADGSGTKVSGDMCVDDFEAYPGFTKTVVGDYTTGVANLPVWATASGGTKSLQRLEITNGDPSGTAVAAIVARDAATAGAKVLWSSPPLNTGATVFNFGVDGLMPYEKDSTLVEWKGCFVCFVAVTAGVSGIKTTLPAVIATTNYNVRATYKG